MKAGGDKVNYAQKQQQIIEGIVKNLKFLGLDGQVLTAGKSGKVPLWKSLTCLMARRDRAVLLNDARTSVWTAVDSLADV